MALAEVLPGTPLAELLDMCVDMGMSILLAAGELAASRAARMEGRPSGDGSATQTITGGLDVLGPYMRRGDAATRERGDKRP